MEEFKNKIVCGDCIEVLGTVREPFADLIFADPPFNIGYEYDTYDDVVDSEEYVAWTGKWMEACCNVLKPTGSFYVAIGDDFAAHVRIIGDKLGLTLRNWIIWHYTFGQQTKFKFARAHTHVFYFTKDPKNFTFNDYAVRVPSDRQLIYNDKRADPRGKMPDDVWNQYSRVCGTFKERQRWHPCQMPELLLARIIAVSSNPGDFVFDPFSGSGTTAAVACQLERIYSGTDISESYVANTAVRIRSLKRSAAAQACESGPLTPREDLELKRLFVDVGIPAKEIQQNPKILGILTEQLALRMNNNKRYQKETIAVALADLTSCLTRNQRISG
ncbi:MAG: site-specific DNA-methyltransferase [Phycisphaerae bacterium]|nr:site-specific DNA-methyltransferase [Phycisphaerae bacterium]